MIPRHQVLTLLFALFLSLISVLPIDLRSAGGMTPDSLGYLEFEPIRQPLYGLWANTIFQMAGNWRAVGVMQLVVLIGSLAWYYFELARWGRWGRWGALASAGGSHLLLQIGAGPLIVVLMTEGLFMSGIVALSAVAVRCARNGLGGWNAGAAMGIIFLLSQLRPAVLLTLSLPFLAALVWAMTNTASLTRWRIAALWATGFVVLLMLGPMAIGKKPFEVGTPGEGLGFALLPRVGQLQARNLDVPLRQDWLEISQSWQGVAANLDMTEAALFDGQIQEAIRIDLGPRVLMPSLSRSENQSRDFSWSSQEDRLAAKAIAVRWIFSEPVVYLQWSAVHFLGTLTAATFASESQRLRVWRAIRSIDPRVWEWAPLRDDYPNNKFSEELKQRTSIAYTLIRLFAGTALVLGFVAIGAVLLGALNGRRIRLGVAVGAFGFAWVALHALTVGLTTFPEFRFVYVTLWGDLFFGVAAVALLLSEISAEKKMKIKIKGEK